MVRITEEDYLAHYGILRRSGRYPWGSGGDVEQRSRDFRSMVADLRKEGLSEVEIANMFSSKEHPFTTTDLRALNTIARAQIKAADISMAQRLKDRGWSNQAIADRMGLAGESSVRSLLQPTADARARQLEGLNEMLKDQIEQKGMIDVGVGVEHYVGANRTQLDTALAMLKAEGYSVHNVQVDDPLNPNNKTTIKVLAKDGVSYADVKMNIDDVKSITTNVIDGDIPYVGMKPPLSVDSKRVGINYAEDGGTDADGVIYVRRGVDDVSLGGSSYAQVRIAVDGSHYLKGMAIYKDGLPDGVDLVFNTNKSKSEGKLGVMKPMKDDPEDPFGSAIKRQLLDPKGTKTTSVMNIVNDEGDWDDWSKNLASQMLSKQKSTLAKEQLDKTFRSKKDDLDEILSLTNPAVRKKMLDEFADSVDSSSVHLKAAPMDRQRTQVILPVNSLKATEIYAPNFKDGERVALVRYPHGGTFEIPELTVNNRHPDAVKLLGKTAKDAVGINSKVAERLSGADFDGDTVLVIPNNQGKVKSSPALAGLKDFDPKNQYKAYEGMPKMSSKQKQQEMGNVSNLITDMTIKGATTTEIARAVKHSMVVIDAEKHNLNYRQSAIDNGISQLKKKYQGGADKGASTLVSRTTSELRVPERKRHYKVDPATGEKIYNYTGATYTNGAGKVKSKTTNSQKGAEAKDAFTLTSAYDSKGNKIGSSTQIENVYASHSNRLKTLANQARKESVNTKTIPYSPTAKKVYASEVAALDSKLKVALSNAPQERAAKLVANARIKQKRQDNPNMDYDDVKKMSSKELVRARAQTGASKTLIDVTPREWEAIQAGAITHSKLTKILTHSDADKIKLLATPRKATVMTTAKQARAKQLLSSGRTASEVAEILGVPLSTLKSSID